MKLLKHVLPLLAFCAPALLEAGTISSIGGWTASAIVVDGKWTGQPSRAPNRGKYNNYYAVDSAADSYWTIKGSGFGSAVGSVRLSDPSISVGKVTWSNTAVTVRVSVPYTFTQNGSVVLTVRSADGSTASKTIPVVATIQSRGYGQCTWYVAYARRTRGLSPPPTAYTNTGLINQNYVPKQSDVVNFGTSHTSIITSPVSTTSVKNSDGSSTVTYSFTIGEMNVNPAWGERQSSIASKFVVKISKSGQKTIVTGIRSAYSTTVLATGYYRTALV